MIILDENLPVGLVRLLSPRVVTTVQSAGLAGLDNGDLLAAIEGNYDIFVTGDKNIRYQQNLQSRRVAIIELPSNRWPVLEPMISQIAAAIDQCKPGDYLVVELPQQFQA